MVTAFTLGKIAVDHRQLFAIDREMAGNQPALGILTIPRVAFDNLRRLRF